MRLATRRIAVVVALVLYSGIANAQPSLLADLQVERAKYGTPMTKTEIGQMLNDVAYKHDIEGFGLLIKEYGNNCPSPTGVMISCDYLVHLPTGSGFDVLRDQEGAAAPQWGGPNPIEMRMFLRGVPRPSERPFPTPEPPQIEPAPQVNADKLADISADISALVSLLGELQAQLTAIQQQQATDRADVLALVEKQGQKIDANKPNGAVNWLALIVSALGAGVGAAK